MRVSLLISIPLARAFVPNLQTVPLKLREEASFLKFNSKSNSNPSQTKTQRQQSRAGGSFGFISSTALKSSERFNYGKGNANEDYDDDFDEEEEEEEEELDDPDWRSFRARLVSKYDHNVNTIANDSGQNGEKESSWIYETGSTIETGTVLLHRINSSSNNNAGYGLGRQYLHKSVVLILEHTDNEHRVSTKGVILNRPTDLILHDQVPDDDDDDNTQNNQADLSEIGFPIWFGGFDWGIHTNEPKFFCLHSIKSATAKKVSRQVMNGIYFTSIQNAKDLIAKGIAKPKDFWIFSGYIEWEEGELLEEIEQGNWHTVATDATIIRKGFSILIDENANNVEHTGIQTWTLLMKLIHQEIEDQRKKKSFRKKPRNSFDDLMLREWSNKYLRFDEPPLFLQEDDDEGISDNAVESVIEAVTGSVLPGTLIRASSGGNPFLFSEQEFHKSLILIIQDDHEMSIGLILNHPSRKTFELTFRDESSFFPTTDYVHLPVRFGGSFGGPTPIGGDDDDDKPLFILHMSQALRDAKIGKPLGEILKDGIWSCSADECISAIASRIASPEDFMCVDGFCLWTKHVKESGGVGGGVISEMMKGDFEIVPHVRTADVWELLLQQQVLSSNALNHNFDLIQSAWTLADKNWEGGKKKRKAVKDDRESEATLLNDEALKRWIITFLSNC